MVEQTLQIWDDSGKLILDESLCTDPELLALPEFSLSLEKLCPEIDFSNVTVEERAEIVTRKRAIAFARWAVSKMTPEQIAAAEAEDHRISMEIDRELREMGAPDKETPFLRFDRECTFQPADPEDLVAFAARLNSRALITSA